VARKRKKTENAAPSTLSVCQEITGAITPLVGRLESLPTRRHHDGAFVFLQSPRVGTEWIWFRSGLTGQWTMDKRGAKNAFDYLDYYSGCCWSDPLAD
jgi:hypothetical protein